MTAYTKDPSAILDYSVDWTAWLATDELIDTAVWDVPAGISSVAQSNTDYTATIRLGGGSVSTSYEISCTITTTTGQVDTRTFSVTCKDQ